MKGIKIRPDPLPFRNDKRRDFCSRYDGYGDFCSGKARRKCMRLDERILCDSKMPMWTRI